MHRLFPFCRDIYSTFYETVVVRKEIIMTTESKIVIAMAGGFMAIATGIYAFVAKRIDTRSEAEFQAYMRNLETRVDSLETEETDE